VLRLSLEVIVCAIMPVTFGSACGDELQNDAVTRFASENSHRSVTAVLRRKVF
jgi:hypothetical protein